MHDDPNINSIWDIILGNDGPNAGLGRLMFPILVFIVLGGVLFGQIIH